MYIPHTYDTVQSPLNIIYFIVFEDPLAFIRYLQLDLVSKCIMVIYYDWIARQL